MKRYLLCDVKSNQSQITNFPMSQKTNTAKEQKYVRLIANKLQTEFITHKRWSRPDCLVTDSKAKAVMDVSLLYFISIPIALTVCFNNIIFVAKRRQTTHKYKATQSVDGILWASKSRCPWSIHECFWTFIDHWKIRIEFCLLFSFACLLLLVCSLDWCVFFFSRTRNRERRQRYPSISDDKLSQFQASCCAAHIIQCACIFWTNSEREKREKTTLNNIQSYIFVSCVANFCSQDKQKENSKPNNLRFTRQNQSIFFFVDGDALCVNLTSI